MFCFARSNKSDASIPAVILDYNDPLSDHTPSVPPIAFFSNVLTGIAQGILPSFKLIHFPHEEPPCTLDGVIAWHNDSFEYRASLGEVWTLDLDICLAQNDTVESCCLRSGYPADCPVLSCHSEKPILKLLPTTIGNFYRGNRVDGLGIAKEWVAGLTVVHHLSTRASLNAIRRPCKRTSLAFSEEKNVLLMWWCGPKPTSLEDFLVDLYFTQRMSAKVQSELFQHLPHYTGFYRCAVYLNEVYLDDESNLPYPTEVVETARRTRFTNKTKRRQLFLSYSTQLTLNLSADRKEVSELRLNSAPISVFLLPYDLQRVSQQVGIVRSRLDIHSARIWKEYLMFETQSIGDQSVFDSLVGEVEANMESLSDPKIIIADSQLDIRK